MSGLKRLFPTMALAVLVPTAAVSEPGWRNVFASCAGRLSAQLEHQWLMMDATAVETERRLSDMLDLLDALTTDENAVHVMALRIDAKHAHLGLLRRATFNPDETDADWADRKARREVTICAGLILSDPGRS